jgi:anti-sigma regulatory factor (Ser/Thr protein kinase)
MTMDVRLPPTEQAPALAREWVGAALEDASPKRVDTARLLVSELVSNSVRHADLAGDDSILLSLEIAERRVRVEVTDPGPGFEALPSPESHLDGGYGLVLVDQMADRWGVRSQGVASVWFELEAR